MDHIAKGRVVIRTMDRVAEQVFQLVGSPPAGVGEFFRSWFYVVAQPHERVIAPRLAVARPAAILAAGDDETFLPHFKCVELRMQLAGETGVAVELVTVESLVLRPLSLANISATAAAAAAAVCSCLLANPFGSAFPMAPRIRGDFAGSCNGPESIRSAMRRSEKVTARMGLDVGWIHKFG